MERKLAAILAADVVGYTRLMGDDEAGTLHRLNAVIEDVLRPLVASHRGRIVKLIGDGLLVEFSSAVDSVNCAVDWHRRVNEHQVNQPTDRRFRFRIGVNMGDVIVEDGDIHGDGVNIAARLEALSEPGGICVSGDLVRFVRGKVEVSFDDQGTKQLKNVAEPVHIFSVRADTDIVPASDVGKVHPALPDKPSVAVLPFTNMSGDAEQEHFSDGISEDIITALSKLSRIFVVARNSTFTYKGRAVDVKQVGLEQGVRYVLEGSVRRSGNRLRITAQLIDARSGHHIWADRYDRTIEDIFDLQDEITREVTSALQVELTDGERARLWAGGTKNIQAWELVIQLPPMLDSHRRTENHLAKPMAEQALKLDPDYASAWAMLGWSHWNDAFNLWSDDPDRSMARSLEALNRSLALNGTSSETLALLAFLHLSLRNFDQAQDYVERAMTLGPNYSFAAGVAANVELFRGRPQNMERLIKRAIRLSPVYPAWYIGDLGFTYFLTDRHEDAVQASLESLKIDPDYIYAHYILAATHGEQGHSEQARAAVDNILRIEASSSVSGYAQSQPFEAPELLDRMLAGLRKAGLPE